MRRCGIAWISELAERHLEMYVVPLHWTRAVRYATVTNKRRTLRLKVAS